MRNLTNSLLLVPTMALTMLLTGCGAQSGKTIMTQGFNAEPVTGNAPVTGMYKLFTGMSMNATTTVKLKAGDPIGFRKTADGQMEAFAGDQSQVLPKGWAQAYWKQQDN